jgi:hypothetical protein
VIELNRRAMRQLPGNARLEIIAIAPLYLVATVQTHRTV